MSREVAVITHAARDDDVLARRLRASGAHVIELPCVRIEHLSDPRPLAAAIEALPHDGWLVVTSSAGADALGVIAPTHARVAAIGSSTAARLEGHGIAVSFMPSIANGETLARELPVATHALLARSDRASPDAPRILRQRGFAVSEAVAYRTQVGATGDIAAVRRALASQDVTVAIYVESPSALEGLRAAIEPELLARGVVTHVAHR